MLPCKKCWWNFINSITARPCITIMKNYQFITSSNKQYFIMKLHSTFTSNQFFLTVQLQYVLIGQKCTLFVHYLAADLYSKVISWHCQQQSESLVLCFYRIWNASHHFDYYYDVVWLQTNTQIQQHYNNTCLI